MDLMNAFQECWKNWSRTCLGAPDPVDHVWLNELNQAVFSALEKKLEGCVKVRTVNTPAFLYYVEAAGGYGVESVAATVTTERVVLPKDGSFESRVEAAVSQLEKIIKARRSYVPEPQTVFFYTTLYPLGERMHDGSKNTHQMCIRLRTTGWTVDVGHQPSEGNT